MFDKFTKLTETFGIDVTPHVSMREVTGTFICTIVDIVKTKSQKGNDMVKLVFKVLDGEHKGGTFNHYMTMTDKTAKWTAVNLGNLALNVYGVAEDRIVEDVTVPDDMVRNCVAELQKKINKTEVKITVVREQNGEFMNNKIDWLRATANTNDDDDFYSQIDKQN